jgi:hypothetical protein
MPETPDAKPPTPAEQARAEVNVVAEGATTEEKRQCTELVERAKAGKFDAGIVSLTPAICAILFLRHNPHNRDWRVDGAKGCREYARRMLGGQWRKNNATIGFYIDGQIEDGQHRLSGAAIAGHTLETAVVFGIERDAIVTVDDLAARHGSDHAKLNGIADASAKQAIVRMVAAYLIKTGNKEAALRSESEVHDAIRANNDALNSAIDIGNGSLKNIVDPVLKAAPAQALSYLMLQVGWPEQRIREKLALFQTGVSMDGEKTPYFVAPEVIKAARSRMQRADRLSTVKELGIAVFAMVSAERGVRALQPSAMRGAVKKTLPDPKYPDDAIKEAA